MSDLQSHPGYSVKGNSVRLRITLSKPEAEVLRQMSLELSVPVPTIIKRLLTISLGLVHVKDLTTD
jgi:hypothetical protein